MLNATIVYFARTIKNVFPIKSTTDTSTTLYLPIYLLSKFGAELISIINQGSSNEALNYFAMEIKTTNPDIETDVRNLVEISIEPINN